MNTVRFGVNYTPSKNWAFFLLDYNENEIREDLKQISGLGLDHIRICLVWNMIQPAPYYISEHILGNLERFIQLAGEYQLSVVVSVLCGWISGFTFLPAFRMDKNVFTNTEMIEAEKRVLEAVAKRIGKYENFLGIDLGNEFNIMEQNHVTHLPTSPFTMEQGNQWLKEMIEYVQPMIPGKICSLGVDHQPWMEDAVFSREVLANVSDPVPLHVYAKFEGMSDRFGEMSDEAMHALEYSIEFAKAFADDSGRKIWIQETGVCANWYKDTKEQCHFFTESLKNAVQCEGVWGITVWCSHGAPTRFKEILDWEQGLALFDENNQPRPLALAYKTFIKDYKKGAYPVKHKKKAYAIKTDTYKDVEVHGPRETVVLPNGEGILFPATPGLEVYTQYLSAVKNGEYPAIILDRHISDKKYLQKRGIVEIC